jgi:uncharacterized repeat protein (TIGR02543 family)
VREVVQGLRNPLEKSKQPSVDPVSPEDDKVTGGGKPGAEIIVKWPGGSETRGIIVEEDGTWSVTVREGVTLKPGDEIEVIQVEGGKDPSDPVKRTVVGATLTFNPNNDSSSTIIYVNIGRRFGEVAPTPSRNGYTFTGWQDESGQLVPANHEVVGDMVLTAIWQQSGGRQTSAVPVINRVGPEDLVIRGKGVPGSKVTITLPNGDKLEAIVDVNEDWNVPLLEALSLAAPLQATQEEDEKDISGTVNTTVVGATLTFNPNNGSSSTTRTVNIGRRFGDVSTTPSRSGYTFTGWQNESGQLVSVNHEVVGDMVLTAIWQRSGGGRDPRPPVGGGTTSVPQRDDPAPISTIAIPDIIFDNEETPQGFYDPEPLDLEEWEYIDTFVPETPLGAFKENPQTGDWGHNSENESKSGTIDLTALLGIALAALVLVRRRRAA